MRYDRPFDENDSSSAAKIFRLIKPETQVLEIGPAMGHLTKQLSQRLKCKVTCVEIDPEFSKLAAEFCDRMLVANIENLDLGQHFADASFDYIIFADVLEHLYDPWKVLQSIRALLKPDGAILASIPNVSHSGLVLDLMRGQFNYRAEGLLDRTHLRFFTRQSVQELFKQAGLSICQWDKTALNPGQSEFRIELESEPREIIDHVKANPDWDTYQFILKAQLTEYVDLHPELIVKQDKEWHSHLVQVFWSVGTGFHPQHCITRHLFEDGQPQVFDFKIEDNKDITAIRLDPLDCQGAFQIKSLEVVAAGKTLYTFNPHSYLEHNHISYGDLVFCESGDLSFFTSLGPDPQIVLDLPADSGKQVSISLSIQYLPRAAFQTAIRTLASTQRSQTRELKSKQAELTSLSQQLLDVTTRNEQLQVELNTTISHSRSLERVLSGLSESCHQLEAEVAKIAETSVRQGEQLWLISRSLSWRVTAPLRTIAQTIRVVIRAFRRGIEILRQKGPRAFLRVLLRSILPNTIENEILRKHTPTARQLNEMSIASKELAHQPLISVVMSVFDPPVDFLKSAIESVRKQVYQNWELCVADDASSNPAIKEMLNFYSAVDPRIKTVFRAENGHISRASNSALAIAQGEFLAFMDHDDELAPHALFEVVKFLNQTPEVDVLYSDEDKINSHGRRSEPAFKAAWAPDYFMSFMYLGHLAVYRRSIVNQVGGFRVGFEGSQDYDLALRISEITDRIRHIPKILYHWRKHSDSVAQNIHAKPYAFKVARQALTEAIERRGFKGGKVVDTNILGIYRPQYPLKGDESLAVFLFTRTNFEGLRDQIEAIRRITVQKNLQFFVRADQAQDHASLGEDCHLISCEPSKCLFWNKALAISAAKQILLIDGDIKPIQADWLSQLIEHGSRPEVGIIGAKICDRKRHILHAGYTIKGSRISHNFYGTAPSDVGYGARLITVNNVSAVSSACMLVRREILLESGVCELNYQTDVCLDVDLGLSAQKLGFHVIWTPYSEAIFTGTQLPTQHVDLSSLPEDAGLLEARHSINRFVDPFYPPNLQGEQGTFKMAV